MSDAPSSDADFILASGSPRRREIVENVGLAVDVIVSDIPEEPGEEETPRDYTRRLAREKAEDVARRVAGDTAPPAMILAADTIVVCDEAILEKPGSVEEARAMLGRLAGSWHVVQSSFCWLDRESRESHLETLETRVRLRELSEDFIANYAATGEPLDKAGGYGIQDKGSVLVEQLEGSYFNVVGLPICEVLEALETMGRLEIHPFLEP